MLLVMNTTSLFDPEQQLTVITKDRLHTFLPGLWDEVFKVSPPTPTATEVIVIDILKRFLSQLYFSRLQHSH